MENKSIERYNAYIENKIATWVERFTWNGLYNDTPQNLISIVNFAKETQAFRNIGELSDSNGFYRCINTLAYEYAGWCGTKDDYSRDEIVRLDKFFKGAIGEFFFMVLLQEVKCLLVNGERLDFSYVCPRLAGEHDFGVDLTGTVSVLSASGHSAYRDCAIQVKFWNPENDTMITNQIVSEVYTDASCNKFIDENEPENVVICWLGDTRRVSRFLKENRPLYRHIIFVDKDALDKSVNKSNPYFWNTLRNELIGIESYKSQIFF